MKTKHLLWSGTATVVLLLVFASAAMAGGGQHYPNGAEDIYCGACPPPGWWAINYFLYYDIDKAPDGSDFDGTIWAEVVRLIYSSDKEILGGRWLSHAFIIWQDIDLKTMGLSDNGFADLIIDPCIITWAKPPWFYTAGLDIYVPIGEYDENQVVNVGKNFWTFEPVFAVTGMFENGWSVSAKFMYAFNTENDDYLQTKLEPGQEFHVDYAVDYDLGKGFRGGLNGYYYKQISDDEIDGVDQGLKGEVFAIGPVVKYDWVCSDKHLSLIGKALFEVDSENRFEGTAYWLKFVYQF